MAPIPTDAQLWVNPCIDASSSFPSCQHKKHSLEASQLIAPLGLTLCFLCCDYCKQRSKRWTRVVVHEPFRVFGPCPVVQRFPSTPGSSALQVLSVFTWPSCQYHSLFLHQMSVIDACSLNLRVHRFPSPLVPLAFPNILPSPAPTETQHKDSQRCPGKGDLGTVESEL